LVVRLGNAALGQRFIVFNVNNKCSMEEYDKIMRILTDVYHKQKTRSNATKEILHLFSVSQRSELFFAVLKWAKQADLDYPSEILLKDFEQFTAKNCS